MNTHAAGISRIESMAPATAAHFIALGYFFGREIQQALGAPIGLVHSSVGGTPIADIVAAPR